MDFNVGLPAATPTPDSVRFDAKSPGMAAAVLVFAFAVTVIAPMLGAVIVPTPILVAVRLATGAFTSMSVPSSTTPTLTFTVDFVVGAAPSSRMSAPFLTSFMVTLPTIAGHVDAVAVEVALRGRDRLEGRARDRADVDEAVARPALGLAAVIVNVAATGLPGDRVGAGDIDQLDRALAVAIGVGAVVRRGAHLAGQLHRDQIAVGSRSKRLAASCRSR